MLNYWWVTRPKRKLNSIPEVLATFADMSLNQEWEGQRDSHLAYEDALEKAGLKRVGDRRDQTGGGARTYKLTIRKSDSAGVAVPTPSSGSSAGRTYNKGDVNNDGTINIRDIILVKRHIVGMEILTGDAFKAADVNEDGVVNIRDLVILKRYMVGMEDLD